MQTVGERVALRAVGLLERATEMKFFFQFLSIVLYLDLGSWILTGRPFHLLTWEKIQHTPIGASILVAFGYFFLMGFIFRILYSVTSYISRMIYIRLNTYDNRYTTSIGMVSVSEALQKAYDSKDSELRKAIEAHKLKCEERKKRNGDLAYFVFSVFCLAFLSLSLITDGVLVVGYNFFNSIFGINITFLATSILTIFCASFLFLDIRDFNNDDHYMYHLPLYKELKANNESEVVRR